MNAVAPKKKVTNTKTKNRKLSKSSSSQDTEAKNDSTMMIVPEGMQELEIGEFGDEDYKKYGLDKEPKSVTVPEGVTKLKLDGSKNWMWEGLEKLHLPDGLQDVYLWNFTKLHQVTLPKIIKELTIGFMPSLLFDGSNSDTLTVHEGVEDVYLDELPNLRRLNILSKNIKRLKLYSLHKLEFDNGTFVVPESTETVDLTGLQNLRKNSFSKKIKNLQLWSMDNLQFDDGTLVLPENIEKVTLGYLKHLRKVEYPESATKLTTLEINTCGEVEIPDWMELGERGKVRRRVQPVTNPMLNTESSSSTVNSLLPRPPRTSSGNSSSSQDTKAMDDSMMMIVPQGTWGLRIGNGFMGDEDYKKFGLDKEPKAVTVPKGVTQLEFQGRGNWMNQGLEKLHLPDGIKLVRLHNLEKLGSNSATLTLPDGVTDVHLGNLKNLRRLDILSKNIKSLRLGSLDEFDFDNGTLVVPDSTEEVQLLKLKNLRKISLSKKIKMLRLSDMDNLQFDNGTLVLPASIENVNLSKLKNIRKIECPESATNLTFVTVDKVIEIPAWMKSRKKLKIKRH